MAHTLKHRLAEIAKYLGAEMTARIRRFGQGENLASLIVRAGMDEYGFTTRVVRPISDIKATGFRIAVGTPFDSMWRDCVGLRIHFEEDHLRYAKATWYETVLSPARARILAHHLLRLADYQENHNGMNPLDQPESRPDHV